MTAETPHSTRPDPVAERPVSLTDWLRGRSDAQLAELLRRRPDLALPAPADLAMLASRLSVRTSVQRAVDTLDAFVLQVLEALVLAADGASAAVTEAARLLGPDVSGPDIARAVEHLQALGLIWGPAGAPHLVASVLSGILPNEWRGLTATGFRDTTRVAAGTSSDFVSPTSGWTSSPSTVSRAPLVRYSCARWIGFLVWKPTMRFQPRRANSARVSAGSSASSG